MEEFEYEMNIKLWVVKASSFPEGVLQSHQKLHELFPPVGTRRYFGLSRPSPDGRGKIDYWAGVEQLPDDDSGLDEKVIKKGRYVGKKIKDFRKDVASIGNTFQAILKRPDIDPEGYCVEWYENEDVQCMVRVI
ncbi:MAG: transcriptional regulator [Cyclobacteriaceae bacterium]|nr:transcriptional regulator [Cyclobacteriaceae bacterium]